MFEPRSYQSAAVTASLDFFRDKKQYNGVTVLPTGSGKSVVIAMVGKELTGKTLVLQPSKEILAQNYQKYISYGFRAGIYSASAGMKFVDNVTFAMIGSVIDKWHLFKDCKHIIVDECHLVNPEKGMYKELFDKLNGAKVLGLTATPYRLASGPMLRFITRTRPKVFNKCLYYVQNQELFDQGHLAKLRYFKFDVINRQMLETNSSGTDFTEASLRTYYRKINMAKLTAEYAARLLTQRRNLLIFSSLIEEAEAAKKMIPGSEVVTGKTPATDRDRLLVQFKRGQLRCLINVGVLTTGFDFPGLECVLMAKSTMSLALYYQIIGRVMRPYTNADGTKKEGWFVDLGGNLDFFGKIETMKIRADDKGLLAIWNKVGENEKQLTNVLFEQS